MLRIISLKASDFLCPVIRAGIESCGHRFVAEAKYPAPFNAAHFFEQWPSLIRFGVAEFFVNLDDAGCPNAVLGAMFVQDLFSGQMSGSEIFWFVNSECRGSGRIGLALFNTFEARCDERECKLRVMAHIEGLRGESLSALYERRGYVKAESFFRKVVV